MSDRLMTVMGLLRKLIGIMGIAYVLGAVTCFANTPRIISLAPNLTEIVEGLGAGEHLVALSSGSANPKQLPVVANAAGLSLETIVALKPTLVLAWQWGHTSQQLAILRQMGIHVEVFQFQHMADIPLAIKRMGDLLHHQALAKSLSEHFLWQWHELGKRNAHRPKVNVFYALWSNPLFTVGQSSLINEAIEICGGRNIFADIHSSAAVVSMTSVWQRQPRYMVSSMPKSQWSVFKQAQVAAWRAMHTPGQQPLYASISTKLEKPDHHFIEGVQELCAAISTFVS